MYVRGISAESSRKFSALHFSCPRRLETSDDPSRPPGLPYPQRTGDPQRQQKRQSPADDSDAQQPIDRRLVRPRANQGQIVDLYGQTPRPDVVLAVLQDDVEKIAPSRTFATKFLESESRSRHFTISCKIRTLTIDRSIGVQFGGLEKVEK